MSSKHATEETAKMQVENIGGIAETSVTFSPGVTILEGRNATNRTSLLQAAMAAFGSDRASMKADAEEASVELQIDDQTYTRLLERTENGIRSGGDPYLENATVADLFAFLLESNEARRAVARGENLRELIMQPVDTDEIQREIDRLLDRRRELDTELENIDALKKELPRLEEERTRLKQKLEQKRKELQTKEAEIEAMDASVSETRETKNRFEELLDELQKKRSTLEEIRSSLETERDRLEALQSEQKELQEQQIELSDSSGEQIEQVQADISKLRRKKQSLQTESNSLQSVIEFNEEMLDAAGDNPASGISTAFDAEGSVTDQLVDSGMACWTCGSTVDREQIESTLEELRELSKEKFGKISDIEEQLEELNSEKKELKKRRRRRERAKDRLETLKSEIRSQEEAIGDLEQRRDALKKEIEEHKKRVEEFDDTSRDEILDQHKQANQIEYQIGRIETELEDVTEEISEITSEIDREEELQSKRAEIKDRIQNQRTKIERLEKNTVEEFNTHMENLLDLLGYDNLERIWLERKEASESAQKASSGNFELHVVRSTDSGTTYEDVVNHLSESERQVTGLVFALAGYLVHELHDTVPFMLLDSLESIDSERIADLIDYFSQYSDYLIAALLPEDAEGLDDSYQYITEF